MKSTLYPLPSAHSCLFAAVAVFALIMTGTPLAAWATQAERTHPALQRDDYSLHILTADSHFDVSGIPFLVQNLTTGEQHIAVTDGAGRIDTGGTSDADQVNKNDAHLSDRNLAATDLPACRLWFSRNPDGTESQPDSHTPALAFGRYRVQELPCGKNEGHELHAETFEICASRSQQDDPSPAPTGLPKGKLRLTVSTEDNGIGFAYVPCSPSAAIRCAATCSDVQARGNLHLQWIVLDAKTLRPLRRADGTLVAGDEDIGSSEADRSTEFEVPMQDIRNRCGAALLHAAVVDGSGTVVAVASPGDDPDSKTFSLFGFDYSLSADSRTVTTAYRGLRPGACYSMVVTELAEDAGGDATGRVIGSATFYAQSSCGSATALLDVAASNPVTVSIREVREAGDTLIANSEPFQDSWLSP